MRFHCSYVSFSHSPDKWFLTPPIWLRWPSFSIILLFCNTDFFICFSQWINWHSLKNSCPGIFIYLLMELRMKLGLTHGSQSWGAYPALFYFLFYLLLRQSVTKFLRHDLNLWSSSPDFLSSETVDLHHHASLSVCGLNWVSYASLFKNLVANH